MVIPPIPFLLIQARNKAPQNRYRYIALFVGIDVYQSSATMPPGRDGSQPVQSDNPVPSHNQARI